MTDLKPAFAFVIPWPPDIQGGVNHVIHHLARECAREGKYEPVIIESSWEHRTPAIDSFDGCKRIRVRMRSPVNESRLALEYLAWLPAEAVKWRKLIREHRIVAINGHFPHLHLLTVAGLRRLGLFSGRVILSYHGTDARMALSSSGAERSLLRTMMGWADAIAPCSKGLGDELLELDPGLRPKTLPVVNGMAAEDFLSLRDPGFDPGSVLPSGRRIILNVGSFRYFSKGHDILVKAFQIARRRIADSHLVLIGGTGSELEAVRELVESLGLRDSVSILVDQPYSRIPAYLAAASLFVLSSRWIKGKMGEGLPLSVLEAGVAGTPVVATRSTGVDEVITDGIDGRLVPLEDPPALAEAIVETLAEPDAAASRAARLRERITSGLTWASRWQLYRKLAES